MYIILRYPFAQFSQWSGSKIS